MSLAICLVRIIIATVTICYAEVAAASPFKKSDKTKIAYETDGHYWTVLVVATLLKIPEAKAIAYAAEYPDNVINKDGYIIRSRYTFLYPKPQIKVHALTGGNPEYERLVSFNMLSVAQTADEKGIACHRVGDSFAHANDKSGKMFPHLVAHLFEWKKPDKVRNNANKYIDYVLQLVKGLGSKKSEINMTVFDFIARSGLSSAQNCAILKAEYHLLTGSTAFNIKKDDLAIVEKYLSERMMSESYAVHTDSDEKGRVSTTIILLKNTDIANRILPLKEGETKYEMPDRVFAKDVILMKNELDKK